VTELAEYVLNRCIARKYFDDPLALFQREVEEMVDSAEPVPAVRTPIEKQTSVTYDFQFLDDFSAASKDIEVKSSSYCSLLEIGAYFSLYSTILYNWAETLLMLYADFVNNILGN